MCFFASSNTLSVAIKSALCYTVRSWLPCIISSLKMYQKNWDLSFCIYTNEDGSHVQAHQLEKILFMHTFTIWRLLSDDKPPAIK